MPHTPDLPRILGPDVVGEEEYAAQLDQLGTGRLGPAVLEVTPTVVNAEAIGAVPDELPPEKPKKKATKDADAEP